MTAVARHAPPKPRGRPRATAPQGELTRERILQVALALIDERGLRGRVQMRLADYRQLSPERDGGFDRIASVASFFVTRACTSAAMASFCSESVA